MKSKPQLRLGSSWERPSSCGAQRSLCRRRRRRSGSRSGGRLLGSSLLCWSLLGAGLLRRRSLLSGRLFYRRSLLRRYSPLRGRRILACAAAFFAGATVFLAGAAFFDGAAFFAGTTFLAGAAVLAAGFAAGAAFLLACFAAGAAFFAVAMTISLIKLQMTPGRSCGRAIHQRDG